MSKHQSKQQAHLEAMGFQHAEVERLTPEPRTPQNVAAVAALLARNATMRAVLKEYRQSDPERYANVKIVI